MIDQETGEIVGEFNADNQAPFVRNPYNYDRRAASRAVAFRSDRPTRTQQQFKEETDINTIVRRFGLTGELPKDLKVPQSGDFASVVDFQSAMQIVRQAEEAFMELPGHVRARFHNNPQELQDFVQDKGNLEEARKLGIAVPAPVPPAPPEPMPVRVVSDAPAAPPGGGKTSST